MRAAVRSGFAGAAWSSQTIIELDAIANQWQSSYDNVCHKAPTQALVDVRMRCRDLALARFSALTGELARLDGPGRIAAPAAVAELPQSEACETMTVPGDVALPPDPALRAKAEAAETGIDRAWAAFALGRYQDARGQLDAIGDPPMSRLHAAALLLRSSIDSRIGDPAAARKDSTMRSSPLPPPARRNSSTTRGCAGCATSCSPAIRRRCSSGKRSLAPRRLAPAARAPSSTA